MADLLENWHLPLTDFMPRVQTYYGQVTRQRLDVDSVVTRQSLRVAEWHLYGSSRLGIYKTQDTLRTVDLSLVYKLSDINLAPTQTLTKKEFYTFDSTYTHKRGDKFYEGSNHLGNVLVTFSDKRLATCTEGQLHYQADVRSATDYAAFHSLLDDRQWYSSTDSTFYRYGGSNGQEQDDEIYGTGNSYSAEFWQYDPRLARRWNVDPASEKYVFQTPYNTFHNNPIYFTDLNGDEPPEKFGAFKRFWNWISGNNHLNKANELASKTGKNVYSTFGGVIQFVGDRPDNNAMVFVSRRLRKDWMLRELGVNNIVHFEVNIISEAELAWNLLKKEIFPENGVVLGSPLTFYDDILGTESDEKVYARVHLCYDNVIRFGARPMPIRFGKHVSNVNAVYMRFKRVNGFVVPYIGKSFNVIKRHSVGIRNSRFRVILSNIDDEQMLLAIEQLIIIYIRSKISSTGNIRNAMAPEKYAKYANDVDKILQKYNWQKVIDDLFKF